MAVYVDDAIWHWKGRKWCHLLADDEAELHRFAHRTYVPASEQSRSAGAGAGLSDND